MKTEPSKQEQQLIERVLTFKYDPLGFVMYAFPWGEKNTPLHNVKEPRNWQIDDLMMLGEHLQTDKALQKIGAPPRPLYLARSSGRGPGKSALLSMLNYWLASCWIGGTAIVTANTEAQLRTRTMAELGKWHTMAINRHWFEKSSMVLRPQSWFKDAIEQQLSIDAQYYYVEGQTWSEENPDAFAGAHSQIAMMLSYDEASGIPDPIWAVSEGFFTDLAFLRLWTVISNPRQTTGRFFDCFHKDKGFWHTKTIDSRTVEGIDATVYQRIADKYGEDHDVTRVEVKGEFPKTGEDAVISLGLVEDAVERDVAPMERSKTIWGLDVARFGMDRTVLTKRRGNELLEKPLEWRGKDLMQTTGRVVALYEALPHEKRPDIIVVDAIGLGAGVVDRLREAGVPVKAVNVSESPAAGDRFMRLRDELYFKMREWFEGRDCRLPVGCEGLIGELTLPTYEFRSNGKIKVASKQEIRKKSGRSPDLSDSFMLTFAVNDRKINYDYSDKGEGYRELGWMA
jgi:hypothetical protein